MEQLSDADFSYAVTGSFAANRYAPLVEQRLTMTYGRRQPELMGCNVWVSATPDTGGNVLIGQPFDPVVFDRTECDGGLTYARVTQVAADLMTGRRRGPVGS